MFDTNPEKLERVQIPACDHSRDIAIVVGIFRFVVCYSCAEDILNQLQAVIHPMPGEAEREIEHER